MTNWLVYDRNKSNWLLPAVFLAIYIILDWNVARAGGFALIGGIIPIMQVHFLLYLASITLLLVVGLILCRARKFAIFLLYISSMTGVALYSIEDQERVSVRQMRVAQDALYAMLKSPHTRKIWYVEPGLEKSLLDMVGKEFPDPLSVGTSKLFHTYSYRLGRPGMESLDIEVLLLRNETRFVVKNSPMSTTG
ncbi:hypothetical protein PO883_34535, partial [Massilia sp. DJPM01]|uniref:hypothetical protein n=1 Tax=Massilia sp. DJPM01 TaxID=3024404 RepID=UPI00259FAED5